MELLCRAPEIEITNQGDWGRSLESDKCEIMLHFGICAGKMAAVP